MLQHYVSRRNTRCLSIATLLLRTLCPAAFLQDFLGACRLGLRFGIGWSQIMCRR